MSSSARSKAIDQVNSTVAKWDRFECNCSHFRHHILVNQKVEDPMAPLPADDKHRHFGNGQTETILTLPPGRHTLQLIFGDHNHIPHNPIVASDVVTITVK